MKGRWGNQTTRTLHSIPGATLRGNRTLGNPFTTLGMEWCSKCKQEMDCDTHASHRSGMYVFKRWCRRCGTVIKYGTYSAPLLSSPSLPAAALEWVTSPEKDRR